MCVCLSRKIGTDSSLRPRPTWKESVHKWPPDHTSHSDHHDDDHVNSFKLDDDVPRNSSRNSTRIVLNVFRFKMFLPKLSCGPGLVTAQTSGLSLHPSRIHEVDVDVNDEDDRPILLRD